MQQSVNKDRFIPIRKSDLIKACMIHGVLAEGDKQAFNSLCKLIVSTLHFEYHQTLEVLKDTYASFDPNADTLKIEEPTQESLQHQQGVFAQTFSEVLNAANFEKVTEQDLQEALKEKSLFKVRLAVEFDDFAEVVFYRRGEYQKTETLSLFWGLKKQAITFTNYDKVAVYIKFKDAEYFSRNEKDTRNFEPNSTIIKLFQNVPKADLEMLFPNSEVRMRTLDKAIIGGSALVGGVIVLVTKLGASLLLVGAILSYWFGFSAKEVTISTKELLALGAGAGVLGGFIFKEWNKFRNRKLKFMKALADNLYFKNLDNNAGVFHHLIDCAEEDESKEAILAYYFLLISDEAQTSKQLDQKIEQWFAAQFEFELNFEVDDALNKLLRFGIVTSNGNKYQAASLRDAQVILDAKWDQIFS